MGLPIAIAGFLLKIPVVLHEQTQKAGLSSKIISRFASVVCISFKTSKTYFKNEKVVFTGNPIREEILNPKGKINIESSKPIIYITGGSTGSHFINKVIEPIISDILSDFVVIHQTGNSKIYDDYKSLLDLSSRLPKQLQERYLLKEFLTPDEVGWVLSNAKLIITRSGINTVTELLAKGAVSILIPLPGGQINEQKENAQLFEKIGLGRYIEQESLTSKKLLEIISDMIKEYKKYKQNQNTAQYLQSGRVLLLLTKLLIHLRYLSHPHQCAR